MLLTLAYIAKQLRDIKVRGLMILNIDVLKHLDNQQNPTKETEIVDTPSEVVADAPSSVNQTFNDFFGDVGPNKTI